MKTERILFVVILCILGLSSFASDVFGVGDSIGVDVGNSVQFYSLDMQTGSSFSRNSKADFVLPAGSTSVFGVGYSVGVVVGNSVQFYSPDMQTGSSFSRNSKADFVLP